MFTKRLVLSCLLLSGVACVCAMETEDNAIGMAREAEVTTPVVEEVGMAVDTPAMDASNFEANPMNVSSEQPSGMKRKMNQEPVEAEELSLQVEESVAPSAAMSSVEEPSMDSQPSMEDTSEQGHADVQGVFESMSREDEDESFPG